MPQHDLTPRQTVAELDRDIVGQADAKRAVAIALPTASGHVTWRFARELLADGAFEPVGDGDVHVWPSLAQDGVAVTLVELVGGDGGSVHLEVPSLPLLRFLEDTAAVVAPGAESSYVDLDGLVAELLAAGR